MARKSFDQVKEIVEARIRGSSERVNRAQGYEDMYHFKWDFEPPEGDWVQPLPSPEPHNAVKGLARLIIAAEPSIKPRVWSDNTDMDLTVERICRALLRANDRHQPYRVMYDIATGGVLFGESYVKVINTMDNAKLMKARGNSGSAMRFERMAREKPFIFKPYNARYVFPEFSEFGMESIIIATKRSPDSIKQFWGVAKPAAYVIEDDGALADVNDVDFYEYYDYETRAVYIKGAKAPLIEEDNKLGFIPFAFSLFEGSSIFEKEADRVLPMLYPVFETGYWHAQSYADSILYSLALSVGKLPQLVAILNDPEQKLNVDWSVLLGVLKLRPGEEIKPMEKKIIDESLQMAKNIADSRMGEMMVPKQVFGASPERVLAYASLNLLVQAGRLPLVPIQRMTGEIMSQMLEIPFRWAKIAEEPYLIVSPEQEDLAIDPDTYTEVWVDVDVRASFAQDEAQRLAVAQGNTAAGLWSKERAMEHVGVPDPKAEMIKIEDELERMSKYTAVIQAEAQRIMATTMQRSAIEGAPGNATPQMVNYRPSNDGFQMCGNCIFFRGAGRPCAVVNTPIDPVFMCDEFAPADQQGKGGAQPFGGGEQPPGGPPQGPPNMGPQGGGGLGQAMGPPPTREMATGVDRTGAPITTGLALPNLG